MVRSAAEQRHARVGRNVHALAAGAARALEEVGLAAFYADAAAIAKLDAEQRAEQLALWEARARVRSATSAVR